MSPRPVIVPKDDDPRIDISMGARQLSSTLASEAGRVNGYLGRTWTTPFSVTQAKEELLRIAEHALELRRLL